MKQLTQKQAVAMAKNGEWRNWTDEEVVKFQLYQNRLCVDFNRFHGAIEQVFGRPVWSHEFADMKALIEEYEGKRSAPTFEEIINLIPEEKRIVIIGE